MHLQGKRPHVHSAISGVLSTHIYDGRLRSAAEADQRQLLLNATGQQFLPYGLLSWSIQHTGYSQRCEPEAQVIADLLTRLCQQSVQDANGEVRRLTLDDVVILSPYNLQVSCLIEHLPAGARVGTVDKLQGQETAVVIVSMATSHPDLLPRDISFAYSLNRLNVAVSRAQPPFGQPISQTPSVWLFFGVLLMPYFFVWFLLRPQYSSAVKITGVAWLMLVMFVLLR